MLHPYQCIAPASNFLIAACGPKLLSLDLENGEIVSEWSPSDTDAPQTNGKDQDNENAERPTKKQKTSKAPPKAPNVIKLAVSPDHAHVVAVTDDKCVRVFEQSSGELTELSQRIMPKRPCAIQILPDNGTILVGDKFGDVYSLPLIPTEAGEVEAAISGAQEPTPQPDSQFKPSATNLTVHSKRNRDALKAQMEQKNFTPKKEALKFEHKLLLGHVSMLTDMKYITCQNDEKERGYIVTADRDEHIRISRAPPQAHIIEGYCLGHKEFVSKICQVGESSLLVSGGGNSWLGIWDWWPEPKLRWKFNLMEEFKHFRSKAQQKDPLVVSGIWTGSIDDAGGMGVEQVIVVACEKVKGILVIDQSTLEKGPGKNQSEEAYYDEMNMDGPRTLRIGLPHYPLDVAFEGDNMFMSVDSRQKREDDDDQRVMALWLRKKRGELDAKEAEETLLESLKTLNDFTGPERDVTHKELDGFLYNVSNLRKRRDQPEGQDGEQENGNTDDVPVDAPAAEAE